MKKAISALLSVVMLSTCVAAVTACGKDDEGGNAQYKYNITVWVGEDTKTMTENMIKQFNETNTQSIYFKATVNEQTESKAAGDVLGKPADAPEIFCFAQDQIARLVSQNLLARPASSIEANVKATHSETSVAAATVGTALYAYPLTEDNGYFLYYDKSVITDEQAGSIEGIIEACESKGKNFSFNLDQSGSGWYAASFFYGAGAKSEWTTDDNGKFTGCDDTYNSDEGLIALKGIQKVLKSSSYNGSDKASTFEAGIPAAAVISGVWDYETAKDKLGDNLGIAKLPTFTVDGQPYQLASPLGCKLLGVTPQTDPNKAVALALLAQYLTNADSQLKRFEERGWGPTVKTLQTNSAVTSSATLSALKASATVAQGQYPFEWWTVADALSGSAKTATSDTALKANLENYAGQLTTLLS